MAYQPKFSKKKSPKEGWAFDLAAAVFLGLMLLGGGLFLRDKAQSKADQESFRDLAELVQVQQTVPTQAQETSPVEIVTEPIAEATTPYYVLYEQNQDFAGWLTVPGTAIDYPVMHVPGDLERYLYKAFDGSHSPGGTPFVGDNGSLSENRCIIYGHNMSDGTMFHDLELYQEKEFWQANPTFTITTPTQELKYEIFAAVRTRLMYPEEEGLRYYWLEDGVEQWLTYYSLYDTGITAQEEDSIVILSTCAYHEDDGRFVVAGKLVEE